MQIIFRLFFVAGVGLLYIGLSLMGFDKPAIAQSQLKPIKTQNLETVNAPVNTEQVTSVSQLSDVRSQDWSFTALQTLVERYGCIAGYPDRTFRGQQSISRYEFASGINACLAKINEIMATGFADKVSQADIATIKKLQEEFATELSTLRDRLDKLATKTTKLEAQQFSPTTKLYGQAILGLQGRFANISDVLPRDGIRNVDDESDKGINLTFGYSLGLTFLTQFDFANRNLLLVSLSSSNLSLFSGLPLRDAYTLLGYEGSSNNQFSLSDLSYRFKVSDNAALIIGAAGVSPSAVFRGPNRFESSGAGPLSAFAQRNPILGLGSGTAGVGFDWQLSDRISLQGVYAAGDPANPNDGGLFGGSYVTGLQTTLMPTDNVDVALYYLHAYTNGGSLKTGIGDSVITSSSAFNFLTDAIGATLNWRINPYVTVGTWGGYTSSSAVIGTSGTVDTRNWMVYLNFPDLFKQGNLAGIYVGQPPKITSSTLEERNLPSAIGLPTFGAGGQPDTTTHVELFYRYRLTDHITITPGLIFVFNPLQTATSDAITIGTLRTTISF
ncbi:iron uptake porin [Pseudanabaena yagii]|uniref:Iron uptake porin n=1 Tax=Pseudanabaena yagii GIHE-NHR1 TaxID=2722753 RepID=A0ABX1LMV3_9CYAN|nr:iron uptake porin [Pseudanabaena yagii]NMF57438.1 iron uptake porin [Pseudanabaena yagii GIHE-NHR1]